MTAARGLDLYLQHEHAIPTYRDRWTQVAFAAGDTDWAAWEAGARAVYRAAGVPWPARVVKTRSPLEATLTVAREAGRSGTPLRDKLTGLDTALFQELSVPFKAGPNGGGDGWTRLGGALRQPILRVAGMNMLDWFTELALMRSLRQRVQEALDARITELVAASLVNVSQNVDPLLGAALTANVTDRAAAITTDAVAEYVGAFGALWKPDGGYMTGQWRAPQVALADFAINEARVPLSDQLRDLAVGTIETTANVHGWWAYDTFVVACARPTAVHLETPTPARGRLPEPRLHRAGGPAIAWADGWGIYYWRGRHVEPWVIEDPTVKRIADEHNVEIRRCAIESMGWTRYLDEAGLKLVATAPDPGNPGNTLDLYDVPWHLVRGNLRLLVVTNGSPERDGTRRRYGLPVPSNIKHPVSAAAWTYGLTARQYKTTARRT